MNEPNEHDGVRVARYVDGEMSADERVAFEARLREDASLSESLNDAQALRRIFAVARAEDPPALRPGLTERVLRRLRDESVGVGDGSGAPRILQWSRWCVLVAAIVFTVALLFATGVLQMPDSGMLQADTDDLIRAIDAKIEAAERLRGR